MRTTGIQFTRTPNFKPTRDRAIDAKAIACPTCSVGVRESCVTAAGQPTGNHPSRRRMAIRALNQEAS